MNLFVDSASKGRWANPRTQDRPFARRDMEIDFTTILVDFTGPELFPSLFTQERRLEIDRKLRIGKSPFDGLSGLARSMGLVPLGQGAGNTYLRLSAPLPLRFKSAGYALPEGSLTVRVEVPSFIELSKTHVSGVDGVTQAPVVLGGLDSWQRVEVDTDAVFEKTVHVPTKKGHIRLFLVYQETQADATDVYVSSVNAWTRACEFFDPGVTHVENLINTRTKKMSVSALEIVALRILSMVGFKTVWFGKCAEERRPDILACLGSADGRKRFVLVECTEENPAAKFGSVAHEAASFRIFISSDDQCEVIPCVYTAIECSDADRQNAAMHGIALIGASETATILEIVRRGQPVETIFAFIGGLRSSLPQSWLLHPSARGPVGPTG